MLKDLKQKPGHPPINRIGIYDHKGNMRGHVGRTATAATVARFLGRHGAELGQKEGRTAWIGDKPPPPPPPQPEQVNPTAVAVAAQNNQGKLAIAEHQSQAKHKLAVELNRSKSKVEAGRKKP